MRSAWILMKIVAVTRAASRVQDQSSLFVRDVHGTLYGPYCLTRDRPTLTHAQEAGAELISLSSRGVRAGETTPGLWYLQFPDGIIRGPYAAEALRAWIDAGHLPWDAPAYKEAPKDPWKTTWIKHLRPHRWRATRGAVRLGKTAAKQSIATVQAVTTKSWAEEEQEWADLVTKSHAVRIAQQQPQQRRVVPPQQQEQRASSRRPPPPGYQQRLERAVDASKAQRADAWHQEPRPSKLVRRSLVALVTAALLGATMLALAHHLGVDLGTAAQDAWGVVLALLNALTALARDLLKRLEPAIQTARQATTNLRNHVAAAARSEEDPGSSAWVTPPTNDDEVPLASPTTREEVAEPPPVVSSSPPLQGDNDLDPSSTPSPPLQEESDLDPS